MRLQRHGEGVLDFADNEDAVEGADTVKIAESAQNEFLIVPHAAGINLQLIVVVAGCVEAFDDFVYICYDRCELAAELLAVMLQTDIAQDHDAVADLDRIDHRHIPLYIAFQGTQKANCLS